MDKESAITIVAFGDSITEAAQQKPEDRWPEILMRALRGRFPSRAIAVLNAGVGGNTSREGLRRMDQDVLAHNPHFVLAEFGNDATPEPDRHVSLEEFVSNLNLIKAKIEEKCGGRLVLLVFPPVIDQWHAWYAHEFYQRNGGQDAYQEHYRKATRKFARDNGVPLADIDEALRKEMAIAGPGSCILEDGVHLTARGNQVVAETVFDVLTGASRIDGSSVSGTFTGMEAVECS